MSGPLFIAKGNATLGAIQRDGSGKVLRETPAQFIANDAGGCVVIGSLDPETMMPSGSIEYMTGDWDAAGYLGKILEFLHPIRPINIPDFKQIFLAAEEDGVNLCSYCNRGFCRDCIIDEWRREEQ